MPSLVQPHYKERQILTFNRIVVTFNWMDWHRSPRCNLGLKLCRLSHCRHTNNESFRGLSHTCSSSMYWFSMFNVVFTQLSPMFLSVTSLNAWVARFIMSFILNVTFLWANSPLILAQDFSKVLSSGWYGGSLRTVWPCPFNTESSLNCFSPSFLTFIIPHNSSQLWFVYD